MEEHKLTMLPQPFGFRNIGATCYFNSLLQALLSCRSMTRTTILVSNEKKESNRVIDTYISMLNVVLRPRLDKNAALEMSPKMWHAMINYLRSQGSHRYFGHGQEDSHEAFVLLMECFEKIPEMQTLFTHTVSNRAYCFKCMKWHKMANDTSTFFSVPSTFKSEIDPKLAYYAKTLHEDGTLQRHLECKEATLTDYICPECKDRSPKIKSSSLIVIPDILIIVNTDYQKVRSANFPPSLTFELREGGKLDYFPTAQIVHSGGTGGGHYWAVAQRKINGQKIWCNLNDSSATPIGTEFVSQPGTYVTFYEAAC